MSAHGALRLGTRDAHEALDALFGGFDLTDHAHYAAFLAAHAEALLPIEAALEASAVARVFPDWAERRRGALIRDDLAALGHAVPQGAPFPSSDDPATLGGILYVVEGSRLGGKLLARRVGAGLPTGYLAASQAPGAWRDLLARLDTLLDGSEATQRAVTAALGTFARFGAAGRRWLSSVE